MNRPAHVCIRAVGAYVPPRRVTNDDLAKTVDTSDEWIRSHTGIGARHLADEGVATSDLAVVAVKDLLKRHGLQAEDIGAIILATATQDFLGFPATACIIQDKLGLKTIPAFDVAAGCTGFIYALEIAHGLVAMGTVRSVVVIGAEKLSAVTDWNDRNTCVLFGDGAGAMIIEPSQVERNKAYFFNAARGDTNNTLTVVSKIKMDGKKVYQFAVDAMQQAIHKVLEDAGLQIEDIDMVIPHQANERIIQSVSKSMSIPMEKFMLNLSEYGNTSAASIPITISEYFDQNETKNKKILLVGFGGGFTWGSAILQL